jgi:hypothetical protein
MDADSRFRRYGGGRVGGQAYVGSNCGLVPCRSEGRIEQIDLAHGTPGIYATRPSFMLRPTTDSVGPTRVAPRTTQSTLTSRDTVRQPRLRQLLSSKATCRTRRSSSPRSSCHAGTLFVYATWPKSKCRPFFSFSFDGIFCSARQLTLTVQLESRALGPNREPEPSRRSSENRKSLCQPVWEPW